MTNRHSSDALGLITCPGHVA